MEAPHIYSELDRERDRRARIEQRLGPRKAPIDAAAARYVQERLGRAIRHRRRMLDLTLQDLAGACGVTFQQVHKYESGLCSLSASQLWAIAQALRVDVAYFYESLSARDVWRTEEPQTA
jgi:ribosome-binding protein aMBF1 (putative translation factor)